MNVNQKPSVFLTTLWNVAATSAVVTLLAAIFVFSQTPEFRAESAFESPQGNVEADLVLIRSATFLTQVVEASGIDAGEAILRAPRRFSLSWLRNAEVTPSQAQHVARLQQQLEVDKDPASGWILVSLESAFPDTAARLVNLIAETYLATNATMEPSLANSLTEAEQALHAYMLEHPEALTATETIAALEALRLRHHQEHALISQRRELAEAQLLQLEKLASGVAVDVAGIEPYPGIRDAYKRAQDLRVKIAEHSTRYGNQHAKMIALNAERKAADALLQSHIQTSLVGLRRDLETYSVELADLESENQQIESRVATLQGYFLELQTHRNAQAHARRTYQSGRAPVLDQRFRAAAIPAEPFSPQPWITLPLVFTLTLVILICLTFLRQKLQ